MSGIGKNSKEEAYSWRPNHKLLKQLEALAGPEEISMDAPVAT